MQTRFKTALIAGFATAAMVAGTLTIPTAADARGARFGGRAVGVHRGFGPRVGFRGYRGGYGYRRYGYPGYYGYGGGTSCGPLGIRLGLCAYY